MRLLERASAAPLERVAIAGAVATATFSKRRRFRADSPTPRTLDLDVSSVINNSQSLPMFIERPDGPLSVEGRKQERDQYTPAQQKQTDMSSRSSRTRKECKTIRRKPRADGRITSN